MQERRKKLRYDIATSTQLVAGSQTFECAVTDIGMGGVLLSVQGELEQAIIVGQQGELRGANGAVFSGKIVRVDSGTVALETDVSQGSDSYVLDTIFRENG